MKSQNRTVVIAIILIVVVSFTIILFWSLTTLQRLPNGLYEGYFVECEDTGKTITETSEPSAMGGVSKYTYRVYECIAISPTDGRRYRLNLERENAWYAYFRASEAEPGQRMQANLNIDDSSYDIVFIDTAKFVAR